MTSRQPTDLDRNIAHAIVGIGVGFFVGKRTGWAGFFIAAIVGVALHQALDDPLADVIAEVT